MSPLTSPPANISSTLSGKETGKGSDVSWPMVGGELGERAPMGLGVLELSESEGRRAGGLHWKVSGSKSNPRRPGGLSSSSESSSESPSSQEERRRATISMAPVGPSPLPDTEEPRDEHEWHGFKVGKASLLEWGRRRQGSLGRPRKSQKGPGSVTYPSRKITYLRLQETCTNVIWQVETTAGREVSCRKIPAGY